MPKWGMIPPVKKLDSYKLLTRCSSVNAVYEEKNLRRTTGQLSDGEEYVLEDQPIEKTDKVMGRLRQQLPMTMKCIALLKNYSR